MSPLKVYGLVFSIVRHVQPSPQSIWKHFQHLRKRHCALELSPLALHSVSATQPWVTVSRLGLCRCSSSRLSYEENHIVFRLLWLIGFFIGMAFLRFSPSVASYQHFISFYGQIIFHGVDIPHLVHPSCRVVLFWDHNTEKVPTFFGIGIHSRFGKLRDRHKNDVPGAEASPSNEETFTAIWGQTGPERALTSRCCATKA